MGTSNSKKFNAQDNIKREGKVPGHAKPLSQLEITKILRQMNSKGIYRMKSKKALGTATFTIINYPNNLFRLPVLITCYHIFNEDDFNPGNKIKLYFNEKEKIIEIDKERKIYKSPDEKYDTVIIELKKGEYQINELFEIDEDIFNNNDLNELYKNESIYILHYPQGGNLKNSYDTITKIDMENNTIEHLCNTEEGSSGAPILSLSSSKILGIHIGYDNFLKVNLGTLLKAPINEFIKLYPPEENNNNNYINQIKENKVNEYNHGYNYNNNVDNDINKYKKRSKSHLKSDFEKVNNFNPKDENELYNKYNISKYYTINYNDVIYNLLKMPDKSAYLVIDKENYFNKNFIPSSKTNNKSKEILYLMNDNIGTGKLFKTKLITDPIGCGLKNENQLNSDPETLRNILIKINKDPKSRKNIIKESVVSYLNELSYDEYKIINRFWINKGFNFSDYEEGKNFSRCFEEKEWILHLPYKDIITFYSNIIDYLRLIHALYPNYEKKIFYKNFIIENDFKILTISVSDDNHNLLKIFEISNYGKKYKSEYYHQNSMTKYYRYDHFNETLIGKNDLGSDISNIFFSDGINVLKLKEDNYKKYYNDNKIFNKIKDFKNYYGDYFQNYISINEEEYSLENGDFDEELYIFPENDKNFKKFKKYFEKLKISIEKIKIIDKIAQKTDYKANIYDSKKIISNFSKDILIFCKLLNNDNINVKNKLEELQKKKDKVLKDIINNDHHITIFKNKEEKFDIFYDNKKTSLISYNSFGNYKYFISSNAIEVIDNQNNSKKFRLADEIEKYKKKNQCHQLLLDLFKKTSSFNQYTIYDEALSKKQKLCIQQEVKYSDVYII